MMNVIQKEDNWQDHEAAQMVKYRIAKNHAWSVCNAEWDYKNKSIDYKILLNPNETKHVTIGFHDICNAYGWKDFKFSDNVQSIYPVYKNAK